MQATLFQSLLECVYSETVILSRGAAGKLFQTAGMQVYAKLRWATDVCTFSS